MGVGEYSSMTFIKDGKSCGLHFSEGMSYWANIMVLQVKHLLLWRKEGTILQGLSPDLYTLAGLLVYLVFYVIVTDNLCSLFLKT